MIKQTSKDLDNTYLITFIVPTFNVQSKIEDNIASISEFMIGLEDKTELIIVDDGSTDDTVPMAKKALKHSGLACQLITCQHAGVSHARNVGLEKAQGSYVMFVDSDDTILSLNRNEILKLLDDRVDIVMCDVIGKEAVNLTLTDQHRVELYETLVHMTTDWIDTGIHSKFYRRELLAAQAITFDVKLRMGEDLLFNFKAIQKASSITFSSLNIYKLCDSSSMFRFDKSNLDNELHFNHELCNVLEKYHDISKSRDVKNKLTITGALFLLDRYFSPEIAEKKISFNNASHDFKKILVINQYLPTLKLNKYDTYLSRRERLMRQLLGRQKITMALALSIIIDRIKRVKR